MLLMNCEIYCFDLVRVRVICWSQRSVIVEYRWLTVPIDAPIVLAPSAELGSWPHEFQGRFYSTLSNGMVGFVMVRDRLKPPSASGPTTAVFLHERWNFGVMVGIGPVTRRKPIWFKREHGRHTFFVNHRPPGCTHVLHTVRRHTVKEYEKR